MQKYGALVLGLGAMGSATACQLAKRGVKVLGIDRFAPPHSFGSSHGDTRMTRLAIGEGAHYTPLAVRSHEIWRAIEQETGRDLLTVTGGLMISSRARTSRLHVDNFFGNTLAAARHFGIPHRILHASDIRRQFPQFEVRIGELAYFEPDAGYLRPEACIAAQLDLARHHGGEIHANETALGFETRGQEIRLTTNRSVYAGERLVLAAGPWLPELLEAQYAAPFKIYRQVLYWFAVEGPIAPFLPENFPVFIWELQGSGQAIYGFPAIDGELGGVKIATEQYETTTALETMRREVSANEIATMHANSVAPYLPKLDSLCVKAVPCLYTATQDSGFVIDTHPESERVTIVSPCSGHGFKHSAAIGEAVAERIVDGTSRLDLSVFKLERYGPHDSAGSA